MYSFGTDEYIAECVRTHSGSMLRAAYAILRSTADAEDAVQEAFIRLITKAPQFCDSEHEKAWLLRVVINISRNMLKSSLRSSPFEELPLSDTTNEGGDLLNAVLSLPEHYRTVIHLYYYEGYSIKEISHILKTPPATIGTRLARGRAILKETLKGDFLI